MSLKTTYYPRDANTLIWYPIIEDNTQTTVTNQGATVDSKLNLTRIGGSATPGGQTPFPNSSFIGDRATAWKTNDDLSGVGVEPTTALTFSFWVKPSVIITGAETFRMYKLWTADGKATAPNFYGVVMFVGQSTVVGAADVSFGTRNDSAVLTNVSANGAVYPGKWTFIAGVADVGAGKIYAYINGQQWASANITGNIQYNNHGALTVLGVPDSAGAVDANKCLQGFLADVRWENVVRTPAQLLSQYSAGPVFS